MTIGLCTKHADSIDSRIVIRKLNKVFVELEFHAKISNHARMRMIYRYFKLSAYNLCFSKWVTEVYKSRRKGWDACSDLANQKQNKMNSKFLLNIINHLLN